MSSGNSNPLNVFELSSICVLRPWYPSDKELFFNRLKADKELVKDVYSAAKKLKMDRVKQVVLPEVTFKEDC